MNKLKIKKASVALNNTSVVIYYSLHKSQMRFPTGINIDPYKDKNGKYLCWDYKTSTLRLPPFFAAMKDKVEEQELKQKTINNLLTRANVIINDYFSKDIQISPAQLKTLLTGQQEEKIQKANTGFFDYFNEFIERKRNHFNARGNILSLKDYNSTKNLLEDFQAYRKKTIWISEVNLLWLQELVQFSAIKHEDYYGEHKVTTEGEMKTSTIKKRLDVLAEFFGYLKELKVVTAHEVDIIKAYKKTIKKQFTHKETLDISEIHLLYKFEFEDEQYKLIRDLFVFLCLTGIRYQDLVEFDRRFIQKSKTGEGLVYVKSASKTGINYNIPLCRIVIEILEKHDWSLPIISGQHGNRIIKEALEKTGLFNDYTQIVDKQTKQYKRRCEAITLHKGRNSFITNLVDTVPLTELMKYSGHRKLSTLQAYVDTKRPVRMDYIKIFDL